MFPITDLIPQRPPMLLVDELVQADGMKCTTTYTVKEDCALCHRGKLTEVGIVEHQAQSASALAGYNARMEGATEPPLGMIGEVKRCNILTTPKVGQQLVTEIEMGLTVGDITTVTAKTSVEGNEIASVTFKIVIK